MTLEHLENLVELRRLQKEAPDQDEFDGLVRSARARIADAQLDAMSLFGRFDLLYNAAHALCLAAMRWHGFRSDNRYLVFQCLPHTLGLAPSDWRVLDAAHRRRNQAEYEGVVEVDEALLASMLRVVSMVDELVGDLGPVA